MGDDSTLDRGSHRRHPGRGIGIIGAVVVLFALIVGIFFRDWIPGPWHSSGVLNTQLPADALADYLPEDSEAVLMVNLHPALESPAGRQLAPSLKQLLGQAERRARWIDLAGIKSLDDVDSLQVSFAPSSGGEPLWLVRGRLDPGRFQTGPDKLQARTFDHFRVWEHADRASKRMTLLAPAGDTLVVSDSPARVLMALSQARDPHPLTIKDAALRELLQKVDRRQSLWFAASFQKTGAVARIDHFLLEMILRPVLTHAESLHGGLDCGEELRADLHFSTATEDNAARLETDLRHICNVAQEVSEGGALLLRQKELVPLVRLLGTGQTSREGKSVRLRCRLTADQLKE
jgi:hypothetical protein